MKATKIILTFTTALAVISLACNFIAGGGKTPVIPAIPTMMPIPTISSGIETMLTQVPDVIATLAPTIEASFGPTQEAKPTDSSSQGGSGDTPASEITSVTSGMDTLESYRATMMVSYAGTDANNQPQSVTTNVLQEFIRSSGDSHVKIDTSSTLSATLSSSVEITTVGGVAYLQSAVDGKSQCVSFSSGDSLTQDPLASNDVFGTLTNLKLVQKGEKINGILSDHYTFDETSFPNKDFDTAKGDIWLAQDGGFAVKVVGTGTGTVDLWQGKGTTTWDYQLQQVNNLAPLSVPDSCTAASPSADYPIPANATNKSTFDKLTTFESPDSPADMAKYYADELTKAGWKETNRTELAGMYMLTYSKDAQELSLTISPGASGSGSTVMIIAGP